MSIDQLHGIAFHSIGTLNIGSHRIDHGSDPFGLKGPNLMLGVLRRPPDIRFDDRQPLFTQAPHDHVPEHASRTQDDNRLFTVHDLRKSGPPPALIIRVLAPDVRGVVPGGDQTVWWLMF